MNTRKILQDFNKKCSDCGIQLVKRDAEIICPKCGMVEDFIDGA